ncbi:MAG: hypothetical protein IJZ75_04135 [Clostridia bacterium]|nr:hypothetical protein [Clostridia bacterium]
MCVRALSAPIAAVNVWAAILSVAADMKNVSKITLSAVCAALSAVFMLTGYFPYLTYAIPAIAGLFIMIAYIEVGLKYSIGAYITSAALVLITAEPETKILYICLFGFYPIVKALVERLNKIPIEWIIKLSVFNACIVVYYKLSVSLLGISYEDMGVIGEYGIYILWIAANAVFVLYDIAVSRMSMFYMARLHPKISKMFKI